MKIHGHRAWINHIAGVWALASQATHNHHHGPENCPTCGPKMAERHNHPNGIGSCQACGHRRCGNPDCPICMSLP
jgi:ribosomal protein L37AE/L43A